jgi:hypothetical protein
MGSPGWHEGQGPSRPLPGKALTMHNYGAKYEAYEL